MRGAFILIGLLFVTCQADALTIVYGDSLAAAGDNRWPDQLGYVNEAIPGTTVPGWYVSRNEWADHTGTHAIVMLGTNDVFQWIAPASWNAYLEAFALHLGDRFDRVTLLHPSPVDMPHWGAWQRWVMLGRAAILHDERQSVCDRHDWLTCNGVLESMGNEWKVLDYVHFTQAGHDEAAIRIPEPAAWALALAALLTLAILRGFRR